VTVVQTSPVAAAAVDSILPAVAAVAVATWVGRRGGAKAVRRAASATTSRASVASTTISRSLYQPD
jgi:hypothetical protein